MVDQVAPLAPARLVRTEAAGNEVIATARARRPRDLALEHNTAQRLLGRIVGRLHARVRDELPQRGPYLEQRTQQIDEVRIAPSRHGQNEFQLPPSGSVMACRSAKLSPDSSPRSVTAMTRLTGKRCTIFSMMGLSVVTSAVLPSNTSWYSGRLDAGSSNIMTVEDPIEYELHGVGQTQVNAKIDLTFAKALRAILRQDPDVIMIGEIRDFETAQIAIQASLTGHLVLATLHTNDAVSAVTRLTDMGVEPFLLSSSLLGVLAQRLVRKLCTACQGAGCSVCGQTGYQGRTGIFELLVADEAARALIHSRAAESELLGAAEQSGLRLMREDGERLVQAGITSRAELLRVTRD